MRKLCQILSTLVFMLSALATTAYAAGDSDGQNRGPRITGPIYDITHFDVIPLVLNGVDFLQTAYAFLFQYEADSNTDQGLVSFRIVNWEEATNHSHIVDVWSSLEQYERHLAKPHSVAFRFGVQTDPKHAGGLCCIGSPIDDRQYSLVQSFNLPWPSAKLPTAVGQSNSALFVITYVDLLVDGNVAAGQDILLDYGAATSKKAKGNLSYSVVRQLDRPNRYAILEVWDSTNANADYIAWQGNAATTNFLNKITPLIGSPLDHRLNFLCGKTYVDGTGCVAP
jgi:quinol monooxygenase YgiN